MIEFDTHVVLFSDRRDALAAFQEYGFSYREVTASTLPVNPCYLLTLSTLEREVVTQNHAAAIRLAQQLGIDALIESEADIADDIYAIDNPTVAFRPFRTETKLRDPADRHRSDIHVDIPRNESTAALIDYLEDAGLSSITLAKADGPHTIATAQFDDRLLGIRLAELIKGAFHHFGGTPQIGIKTEQLLHYDFIGNVPGGPLPKTLAVIVDPITTNAIQCRAVDANIPRDPPHVKE